MAVSMTILPNRDRWLSNRSRFLGGSDASALIGRNPYKTNVELWQEKTGRRTPTDISGKAYVQYGIQAEPYLRKMFELDYPRYRVMYIDNNSFMNEKYPYARASLDGWLLESDTNRQGILEIKTSDISSAVMRKKWDGQLPMNYYCQLLWYLMVTEFDFAYLKAKLRTVIDGEVKAQIRHYRIDREDVQEDINYIQSEAERFWWYVNNDKEPDLILPNI